MQRLDLGDEHFGVAVTQQTQSAPPLTKSDFAAWADSVVEKAQSRRRDEPRNVLGQALRERRDRERRAARDAGRRTERYSNYESVLTARSPRSSLRSNFAEQPRVFTKEDFITYYGGENIWNNTRSQRMHESLASPVSGLTRPTGASGTSAIHPFWDD